MAFAANPLSLSVTEPAFEAWLRDTGYLEVLDNCAASSAAAVDSVPPPSLRTRPRTAGGGTALFAGAFSSLRALSSLFTINPFAKLTAEDLAAGTPSWTLEFVGAAGSYSWPAGPSQAKMRVQENVRRYARNYALLTVLIFACSLYKMPVALLGLIACLLLWELVRFCNDKWQLEERSARLRQVLLRIAQLASAVLLYVCNLQLAIFCTVGVSYAVMILHAFLRKLTPKKPSGLNQHKRNLRKKIIFG